MFTAENVLNQEGWYSLALAIMSPKLVLSDQASELLAGKILSRKSWDETVPEMLSAKEQGMPWRDIADMFGYSVNGAQATVSHWKRKQKS